MNNKISVLIADDNEELVSELANHIKAEGDMILPQQLLTEKKRTSLYLKHVLTLLFLTL